MITNQNIGSPRKKKTKIEDADPANSLKREGVPESASKRAKVEDISSEVDVQALKRKNFVTACEQVSYKEYFNFGMRFQLVYLPPCMNVETCNHLDSGKMLSIMPIPDVAMQSIKIEMNSYTWCEALEICQLCITPEQYLTADILRDIVEIMMNAQEDSLADFTISYLLDRCQQVLSQSFSMHPPCVMKSLRTLYNNFLTAPMDLKDKTYSNRKEFGCDKGIVKYCMNRLENELSLESKDEAIVDKDEYMPEEMTRSVKGLHWQKEKFEIYEILERPERIKRIMTVLESLVELLQFDLAIWHSRYKNNLGSHVMRSHKPLVAFVLWSNNVLFTGVVNNNVRQILRLFVHMIHLQYPEEHIKIMSTWLTVIIQMFYICETHSNSDYPNTGKYCGAFAREFYKILAELPQTTIIRVLEQIYPTFMQHLIALMHIQTLLSSKEDDIIKIFIKFVKETQWELYPEGLSEIQVSKTSLIRPKKVKDFMNFLHKVCKLATDLDDTEDVYPKLDPSTLIGDPENETDRAHVVHTLYIAVDSYLDAYSVQSVQDTLDNLNEQVDEHGDVTMTFVPENCSYSVTEHFIKKYRSIYRNLTELISILQTLDKNEVPEMKIFERIGLL
ncbi:hypothetical protein NE865_02801 [Phthorimaea operculella]|nr:hypothetical protein NE865_02801 [Phthorimaea operculella]